MMEIVGIRFHRANKIYYFHTNNLQLSMGDSVVVETNRGKELGKVVIGPHEVETDESAEPFKPVLRLAGEDDFNQAAQRQSKNEKAFAKSEELIKKLNLPMKPIAAQYNLDGSHLTVFFSAEKRVDFRELVKELSRSLKTHVELRQLGARDEAKMVGGLGRCGYPLCCVSFLSEFNPVSIRMAKDQNITLNPMKTSGLCGRLLCCLAYECDQYRSMKAKMPSPGQDVQTPLGPARVLFTNAIKEAITVQLESGASVEVALADVSWKPKQPHEKKG